MCWIECGPVTCVKCLICFRSVFPLQEMSAMDDKLNRLLYAFGISANYKGFHYIHDAVEIAANNPQTLTAVTRQIYLQIARQRNTNWKTVERNIRTCINMAWCSKPDELRQLTGYSAHDKPTSAQFIAILTHCLTI